MATAVVAGALALTGVAAAQAAPASDIQLTGQQLQSFLLPASYFGAGYWFPANSTSNSGGRLERPVARVHLSSYSCKQYFLNEIPSSGFGETAFTTGQVFKGRLSAWTGSYDEEVYQFPSAGAATSYYRENYALDARCGNASAISGGKTLSSVLLSLTTGYVDGGQAFRDVVRAAQAGSPAVINNDEWVVIGRDVYNVDAAYLSGHASLTPNAATLALVARVLAA